MIRVHGSCILIVDDEPRNTRLLSDILTAEGFYVLSLNSSERVMQAIADYEPDLIVLDVMMPGKNGFELTKEIKSKDIWNHIPIILLTALSDRDSCVKGLEYGAEDFVTKPFNRRELNARISNLLKLKKLHDFQYKNVRLLKEYDAITGLPKQEILLEFANSLLSCSKSSEICVAICELDLKNTLLGFDENQNHDQLEARINCSVAERISYLFPPGTLLGCLHSGKFGIVLESSEQRATEQLSALHSKLKAPIVINAQDIFLQFSVGYVAHTQGAVNWTAMFNRAEMAILEAKRQGGTPIIKFLPEMDKKNEERWWLLQSLQQAMLKDQFEVYYQPQIDLELGVIVAFEALLRWKHPDKGFISPGKFIPIAEENGQIIELGIWMVEQVCRQLAVWKKSGLQIRVAVNISGVQLQHGNLAQDFVELMDKYQLSNTDFEVELTETSLMDPLSAAQLMALHQLGIDIAIDDFGTGYCNLEYLKTFPFTRLKIDQSFVTNICDSGNDIAIVKAILSIAKFMGLKVIAEGVETKGQLEQLSLFGCNEVQGFYFSKPVPADEATVLLTVGIPHLSG